LRKTYYNVPHHQPESLDWFNVLIAQTIAQFRTDAATDDAILTSLTRVLNGPQKPDFLSDIAVTEIALGEDFPIFSNCRVHPVDDDAGGGEGKLEARMDVDLSDFITLGVETMMVLNYPRPRTALLPVALSVSVVRFSGTLSISFLPVSSTTTTTTGTADGVGLGNMAGDHTPSAASNHTPLVGNIPGCSQSNPPLNSSTTRTPTTLAFSFLPNYTLSLSTRSLLGARSRLQDVPKIAQIVEARLRNWFEERCVTPRRQQVVIPSLWPRLKNVVDESGRKGGSADGGSVEGEKEHNLETRARTRSDAGKDLSRRSGSEGLGGTRFRGALRMSSGTTLEEGAGVLEMPGSMPGMVIN